MKTVELTHKELKGVVQGLNLVAQVEPPPIIRTKLGRIGRVVRPEAELLDENRVKLVDQYAIFEGEEGTPNRRYKLVVDAKGEPVPNSIQLTDPAAFDKAEKAFWNAKMSINVPTLTEEDLEQLKITVRAQELLWPVCEFKN